MPKHWAGMGWIGDGDWVGFKQLLERRVQIWQEGRVQNLEDQGSRIIHKCLVYTDINLRFLLKILKRRTLDYCRLYWLMDNCACPIQLNAKLSFVTS